MHRIKRSKRVSPMPWPTLAMHLRAGRGEAPVIVRRRRHDRDLALSVYAFVMGLAVIVASLTIGLVVAP